jgi:septal ring factor EnvC (AmiA/AmiB activator)
LNEVVIAIITGVVSLIAGGGGVFAYLSSRQKAKQSAHDSAVSEWKELYDEMKDRLDTQEQENKDLRNEILSLKQTVNNLTIELQNYKKYDTYINELEKYVDHLLHSAKSMVNEDAYRNLCAKRPRRNVV